MTDEQQEKNKELLQSVEKKHLQSKKFTSWLIVEMALMLLGGAALYFQKDLGWPLAAFMVSIVFCLSFNFLAYNDKQAWSDALIRGIAMTGEFPAQFAEKISKKLKK